MLRIAVPSVLQQSTASIGMMIVQAVVNPFGTQALAGYAATMRVENVFSLIFVSIGNAVSPYVSQNLGAKKIWAYQKRLLTPHWCWICVSRSLPVIVIETLHTPISSLIPWKRWNRSGISGVRGLYEMARIFLHLYGNQDGNRWSPSWPWNYAPVPRCQHGEPCHSACPLPLICAPRYGIAFVWLAVPAGWLANFSDLLCGSQKIMAGLINGTIIRKNMVIFLKAVYNTYKNQWGNGVERNL